MASLSLKDGKMQILAARRTFDVTFFRFVSLPPFEAHLLVENQSIISADAALRVTLISDEPATEQETKFQYLMSFLDLAVAVDI